MTAKPYSELPAVELSDADLEGGDLPAILARYAGELGPVFRRIITNGPRAGMETVFLVGPEANRFVMHTHRDYFSHDLGWTPIVGEIMGKGLLNMDDPEHARHRKM